MTGMINIRGAVGVLATALSILPFGTAVAAGGAGTARIDSLSWVARVDGNEATISEYCRTTVLSPAGQQYGSVVFRESEHQSVNAVAIAVYDDQGKKLYSRSKKDMTKACGFGQSFQLYDDNCSYFLDLTAAKYPYTVEYSYELRIKSLYLLPAVQLAYKIPVTAAVVTLTYQTDRPIRHKLYDLTVEPSVQDKGRDRTLTWTFTNLPAQKTTGYVPPENIEGARLAFAAEQFKFGQYDFNCLTWKNVGLWYRRLSADPDSLASSTEPAPATAQESKALADQLYSEITQAMRYVSVSVGIGGWQPHRLAQISTKSYGDCKDLSAMLVSKLRSHGITAFPCLILTADEGSLDSAFVGFDFNHVITVAIVGNDTLWYDPTCTDCPPGELPDHDEGNTLLVATDTGGVLVTTPLSKPEANKLLRHTNVDIDTAGRMTLAVTVTASGHFASHFRGSIKHLDRKELDEYAQDWLLGSKPTLTVRHYRINNQDDITKPIFVEYDLSCSRPIDRIDRTRYFIPFLFTSRDAYGDAELGTRTFPVWLGNPREVIDSVIIQGDILAGIDPIKLPVDTTVACDWIQLAGRYARADSTVTACLSQRYAAPLVPIAGFDALKLYLSGRRRLLDRPVTLLRSPK